MVSYENDTKKIAEAMRRLHNKEYYLENLIKKPLQETFERLCDEDGLLYEFIDVALLLIFVHIDLFGRLYAGEAYNENKRTTKNAALFMREYLGRVDERYKEVSGLLYHALRHGYAHVFTPKRIQLENGEVLDFSFVSGGKAQHLELKTMEETERSGSIKIHRLLVNVSKLYQDFIVAIDKYAEDIIHDQKISDKFQQSFESRRIEDTEERLRNKKGSNLDSGFEFIYRQIRDAH